MYERYSHTERTVIERGEYPPLTILSVVSVLWVVFFLLLAFIFAAIDGMMVAFGIGALGLLGLLFLLMIGTIPKAMSTSPKPAPPAQLSAPVDSAALMVRRAGYPVNRK